MNSDVCYQARPIDLNRSLVDDILSLLQNVPVEFCPSRRSGRGDPIRVDNLRKHLEPLGTSTLLDIAEAIRDGEPSVRVRKGTLRLGEPARMEMSCA